MNKFLKSVPRPAMPNTTIKPKPERAIDDDSNALFTYHQRINETRNPGTNWLRAQSYPEFVSGLRAIRSTKLFIANAEKAVIHPQNVFETCQQQNKTHPHAQILDITELGVQNQNNLTTEIKRFSQDKRTHDTKRRLDGEQPQEKNHTRPISRNGMETRSQANGVAIQNISVKLPRYPGSGCVDQPLKSSYHNVPVMANIGERILQISIRPETINTHRTCGTQTDTLNAVNGKPFSSLAPSCRTVNQVSAQRPENDESSYVILSRNPSHSSGDSKPPHQTNTGPLSHSLHLHPRPAVQCPSNILNIPYPSTLTVILNRTPILPDSSYHRNFLTVIICPCCQKHISLCYSGTKDCQTATDTDSSPKGRDTINVVNGSGSPTPGTAGGSAKRIATVHVSSYETSSTHIQVAMNKPQSRADMVNMAKNGGDKVLHPETRLENSANLVEKNNNSAKFLHPTTTAGKKPHKSPVPKETFQARRTKADSKECATKTDAVPVDNAGTSEIAATCGVKDEDQQAKGKVINSKSTTSTVLQEPVILREFLSKVVGAGHEKNILSKIGVVRYISEVFQEVFGHLKVSGVCGTHLM
ncbi:hypothetical protein PR048_016919 [Dryococelus australis]|uniref:Uncharacterized protein n=1 Tax=Dryococelus australis TaxID=614101 RepID=A0ABQ9H819_9NEOP|nr:hypothetical protein PR048_016919 [Dryococelus australis]